MNELDGQFSVIGHQLLAIVTPTQTRMKLTMRVDVTLPLPTSTGFTPEATVHSQSPSTPLIRSSFV